MTVSKYGDIKAILASFEQANSKFYPTFTGSISYFSNLILITLIRASNEVLKVNLLSYERVNSSRASLEILVILLCNICPKLTDAMIVRALQSKLTLHYGCV